MDTIHHHYSAVVKEIWITAYKQWYVGNDMSAFPTHLTLCIGRGSGEVKVWFCHLLCMCGGSNVSMKGGTV